MRSRPGPGNLLRPGRRRRRFVARSIRAPGGLRAGHLVALPAPKGYMHPVEGPGRMPPKLDVARALLLQGSVFLHLDPRLEGVAVPPWLAKQPQLVLQIGLDLAVPIPDLRLDDEGVFATLSFNRSPFPCTIPWRAVFALFGDDGRSMVWPESMPLEILAEIEREQGRRPPPPPTDDGGEDQDEAPEEGKVVRLGSRRRPRLVPPLADPARPDPPAAPAAGSDGDEDGDGDDEPPRPGRDLPPYLRIIK